MANDITPFIIRIQTALEKGGIDGAKAELAALTAEAEKAKKANEGASGSSDKLGQSVGKAAELTGSLTAAMAAGGPEAQQLSAGMRGLSAIINTLTQPGGGGILGLATLLTGAAVTAYMAYDKKVEESRKQLIKWREALHDNFLKAQEEGLGKTAAQFDELSKAMDAATAARNRLSAAEAAADNAEKGARLADITLREKQAQFALKPGKELDAAKVSAQFAKERRDLEAEYAAIDSNRELSGKSADLSDQESRLRVTEAKQEELRKDYEKMRDDLNRMEKGRADNMGAKAPTKQVYATELGPGGEEVGVFRTELDKEAQLTEDDRLARSIKAQKPLFEKATKAYMEAIAATVAQEVAVKASKIDLATAEKKNDTVARFTPAINAVQTAAEEKAIREQQAQANLALYRGRLDKSINETQAVDDARRAAAAQFDRKDFRGSNSRTRSWADQRDRELDSEAASSGRDLAALKGEKSQIENATQKEAEAWVKSVESTLNAVDKRNAEFFKQATQRMSEMEKKLARPGAGG